MDRISATASISMILLVLGVVRAPVVAAYDSFDPEVVRMVDSGMAALDASVNQETHYKSDIVYSGSAGERFLNGYASMKVNHDKKAPAVQRAIREALSYLRTYKRDPELLDGGSLNKMNYTMATATLLLAEVSARDYRSQLKECEAHFRRSIRADGAYGYPGDELGDISQTQYAMLALWTLDNAGITIDYAGVGRTIDWLLKVQDVGGGWPYRGRVPSGAGRQKQTQVTPGLAMAGGSALMIAADILDTWGTATDQNDPNIVDLPEAIRLFDEDGGPKENAFAAKPAIDPQSVLAAIANCDRYLAVNSPDPEKEEAEWPYYQIYTLERYESFKELIRGEEGVQAEWYDFGVEYLRSTIGNRGWPGRAYTTDGVSSAFAVLFLIRSTKKSIDLMNAGVAKGSYGIPDDTTNVTVDGGKIKKPTVADSVTGLLNALEADGADSLAGKSIPDNLKLAPPGKERDSQLDRLERLARGSSSWQARRVAFRLLGQSDDMRMVPTLIYGLSDPDRPAQTYARDGLRFISRKFDGYGLKPGSDPTEIYGVQRKWKRWYKTMNPSYVFID